MKRNLTGKITANQQMDSMAAAMAGGLTMSISPNAVTRLPTAAVWERDVDVQVKDKDGNVCAWLNQDYTTAVSIANTSIAGTAAVNSIGGATNTTLFVREGRASLVVSGDAAAWLGGTRQQKTIQVTNGVDTADGTLVVTVTAAGMNDSPKAVNVEVTDPLSEADTAAAIGAALEADPDVGGFFYVDVTTDEIELTAKEPAANDGTMDIALTDADGTGVTVGASADTTAGVAKETDTLTIGEITVMGYTVTGGTSVQTFRTADPV